MARTVKKLQSTEPKKLFKPAMTPETRESQLTSLAYDVAEQRMRDGTASSQEICYFLKQGGQQAKLEREKMIEENKLLRAKTEMLQAQKKSEEMFKEAIQAMGIYNGETINRFDDEDDEYDE